MSTILHARSATTDRSRTKSFPFPAARTFAIARSPPPRLTTPRAVASSRSSVAMSSLRCRNSVEVGSIAEGRTDSDDRCTADVDSVRRSAFRRAGIRFAIFPQKWKKTKRGKPKSGERQLKLQPLPRRRYERCWLDLTRARLRKPSGEAERARLPRALRFPLPGSPDSQNRQISRSRSRHTSRSSRWDREMASRTRAASSVRI